MLNLPKKTVVQWLNEVNYGQFENYIPSEFALHFVNFIKLVNGTRGEENKTPVLHLNMLDKLGAEELQTANLVFRGSGKTTVLAEYLILYVATFGELPGLPNLNVSIYCSDTIDNGVGKFRKNVEYRWSTSEFLQKYVPKATFTNIRIEFENAAGHRSVCIGVGAQSGIRGVKELGTRPQLLIMDDLLSDDDARSDACISAVEDTVYGALIPALHPQRQRIIWSGTPFNQKDPLYKAVESGAWAVNVYPIAEKFPCTKEEFRGAWEDRFHYEFLMDRYQRALLGNKLAKFNQEFMLRITSDDERLIQDHEIRWYSRNSLMLRKNEYTFYITTDFAVSSKQHADFSVILVWAISYDNRWFLVDGICKRQPMDRTLDDLFRLAKMYRPELVGVENAGQQQGFIPWIQQQQLARNVWFTFATNSGSTALGIKPEGDKLSRFRKVETKFKSQAIFFPEEMRYGELMVELIQELELVTGSGFRSKHDDCLDAISQLGMMNIITPSVSAPSNFRDNSGIWELDIPEPSINSYIV